MLLPPNLQFYGDYYIILLTFTYFYAILWLNEQYLCRQRGSDRRLYRCYFYSSYFSKIMHLARFVANGR